MKEKRVKSVRSEKKFQDVLMTVNKLNLLSRDLKRDRFKKSELQIIIKKLMGVPSFRDKAGGTQGVPGLTSPYCFTWLN